MNRPITSEERDAMILSVIGSQRLSGLDMSYDEVAATVDQVLAESPIVFAPVVLDPLPDGDAQQPDGEADEAERGR